MQHYANIRNAREQLIPKLLAIETKRQCSFHLKDIESQLYKVSQSKYTESPDYSVGNINHVILGESKTVLLRTHTDKNLYTHFRQRV